MPARLLLLLLVPLAACGDSTSSPTLADRAAALSTVMSVDTLVVEGEPTPIQFQEISGASFPVPFTARMPRPVRFGIPIDDSTGTAVVFKMSAEGAESELRVVAFPEAFDAAAASAEAQRLGEALGTPAGADASAPAWVAESVRTSAEGRSGVVWLGRHAGRYVAVVSDTALEMSDGFAPRRDYLLRSFTWTDDGSTLL